MTSVSRGFSKVEFISELLSKMEGSIIFNAD